MTKECFSTESQEDRKHRVEGLRRLVWGNDYKRLPFPCKLHMLLSFGGWFASNLWWTNGGKSFAVDREGFKQHIMSVFFDEHKFRSFQTLLHKYGFRMVTSIHMIENNAADVVIYNHKLFVANDFELNRQITRGSRGLRHRISPRRGQESQRPPPQLPESLPTKEMQTTSLSIHDKPMRCLSS